MKALITGGAGFIGSHLVARVLDDTDWEIVVLDKLSYAAMGFDRLKEIGALDNPRIKVLTHDLAFPMSDGIMREIGDPEYIFHLAAESHVVNSVADPIEFVRANVLGTAQLLQYARELNSLKMLVYMSTDEVFGPAQVHQTFFPNSRHNPLNPYSASKSGGEQLATAWAHTYQLPIRIVHCMNVFGERQHPEKFIPKVIKALINNESIDIHTDHMGRVGSRSYIYAGDVAMLLMEVVRSPSPGLKENIAGIVELDNLAMAEFIAGVMKRECVYELVDFDLGLSCHDLRYDIAPTRIPVTTRREMLDQLRYVIEWTVTNSEWLQIP